MATESTNRTTKAVSLQRLPIEIIAGITESIGLQDILNLGLTCRWLQHVIMHNESIAKFALQRKAPFTIEACDAALHHGCWARSLRRLMKRRIAVASGQPFSIAIIAMVDHYIYHDGTLCYTDGTSSLRMLELQGSTQAEIEVDIPGMLAPSLQPSAFGILSFRPIHYSQGVLSCLYKSSRRHGSTLLVILKPKDQLVLNVKHVSAARRCFVRNTKNCVIYGARENVSSVGRHCWVLQRFDITSGAWSQRLVPMTDIMGDQLDKTVCFEILDGYLYAISTIAHNEGQDQTWTSHYHVTRCFLKDLSSHEFRLWRRHHQDGPIHEGWTSLKVEKDPYSGVVTIIEVRMEWLGGESPSVRTCYKTKIESPQGVIRSTSQLVTSNDMNLASATVLGSGFALSAPLRSSLPENGPQDCGLQGNAHRVDVGTVVNTVKKDCCLTFYQTSCNAFVELVRYPTPTPGHGARPLHLRTISQTDTNSVSTNTVSHWPPEQSSCKSPMLQILHRLMSLSGEDGPAGGIMDERTMLYTVKARRQGHTRALACISFDAAFKVQGAHWPNGPLRPFQRIITNDSAGEDQGCKSSNTLGVSAYTSPSCPDTESAPNTRWARRTKPRFSATDSEGVLGFNFAL